MRLWRACQRELVFFARVVVCVVLFLGLVAAIGVTQRFLIFSESCGSETPVEGAWFCIERTAKKAYLANDTAYQQGGGAASTPTLEAARAVDPDITGATSLANGVKICRTGTATCDDAVRIAMYCDAGNICRVEFYNASNALITEGKSVYAASSWIISIDTAGTQTTCLTMDDTGLMTYAALESCGRLSGLVHLEFAEDDGTHTCAAGNFGLWADLSENKLKACQNGSASDLLGAASGDITAVGDCSTGACFASPTATHAFMGGTPAAFRAIADADIPDTITASNYLLLTGGTVSGTLGVTGVATFTAAPVFQAVPTFGTVDAIKSVWIPAGAMAVTSCTDTAPTERTLITNGPKVMTIEPSDADACSVDFDLVMPDAYNGGTITIELVVFSTGNNTTEIFAADCAGQAVSDGDPVGAHSVTGEQEASCTFGAQAFDEQHCTTPAITIQGTPAAGDHFFIRCQVDATASTVSPFTDIRLLGAKVEYGVGTMTD